MVRIVWLLQNHWSSTDNFSYEFSLNTSSLPKNKLIHPEFHPFESQRVWIKKFFSLIIQVSSELSEWWRNVIVVDELVTVWFLFAHLVDHSDAFRVCTIEQGTRHVLLVPLIQIEEQHFGLSSYQQQTLLSTSAQTVWLIGGNVPLNGLETQNLALILPFDFKFNTRITFKISEVVSVIFTNLLFKMHSKHSYHRKHMSPWILVNCTHVIKRFRVVYGFQESQMCYRTIVLWRRTYPLNRTVVLPNNNPAQASCYDAINFVRCLTWCAEFFIREWLELVIWAIKSQYFCNHWNKINVINTLQNGRKQFFWVIFKKNISLSSIRSQAECFPFLLGLWTCGWCKEIISTSAGFDSLKSESSFACSQSFLIKSTTKCWKLRRTTYAKPLWWTKTFLVGKLASSSWLSCRTQICSTPAGNWKILKNVLFSIQ